MRQQLADSQKQVVILQQQSKSATDMQKQYDQTTATLKAQLQERDMLVAQLRQELTDIKTTLRVSQAQQGDAQKRADDLWQKMRNLENTNKMGGK